MTKALMWERIEKIEKEKRREDVCDSEKMVVKRRRKLRKKNDKKCEEKKVEPKEEKI